MIGSPAANRRASCIREERKSPPLKLECSIGNDEADRGKTARLRIIRKGIMFEEIGLEVCLLCFL
jgi:hypothetical protein